MPFASFSPLATGSVFMLVCHCIRVCMIAVFVWQFTMRSSLSPVVCLLKGVCAFLHKHSLLCNHFCMAHGFISVWTSPRFIVSFLEEERVLHLHHRQGRRSSSRFLPITSHIRGCSPPIDPFLPTSCGGNPPGLDEALPRSFGSVRGKHPKRNLASLILPPPGTKPRLKTSPFSSTLDPFADANRRSSTRTSGRRRTRARTGGAWRRRPWFDHARSAERTEGSLACTVRKLDEEGLLTRPRNRTLRHLEDCQT